MVKSIVNSYEIPFEEISIADKYMATVNADLNPITELDISNPKNPISSLKHTFEDALDEILISNITTQENPLEYMMSLMS